MEKCLYNCHIKNDVSLTRAYSVTDFACKELRNHYNETTDSNEHENLDASGL